MVDVRRLIDDVNLQPFGKEQEPKPQFTHLQRELEQEREESMKRPSETEFEKEIFISYAWGGESEEFVNNLERTLQEKGIKDFQESCRGGFHQKSIILNSNLCKPAPTLRSIHR